MKQSGISLEDQGSRQVIAYLTKAFLDTLVTACDEAKKTTTIWPASGNIAAEFKKVPLKRVDSFQEHCMDVSLRCDGRIESIRKTDCLLRPLFVGITMGDAPDTPFLLSLQTRQASRPRGLKILAGGRMENLAVRSTERQKHKKHD